MNKYFIVLAVLLTGPALVFAQTSPAIATEIPNILPPSPTVSELGKYALATTNFNTGAMKSSISLFDFKTPNLYLPVSLNYTADGLKVDNVAGRVGTGWSLNAGGVVSRTILGAPDETVGFLSLPANFPNIPCNDLGDFLLAASSSTNDTQPDIYSFNFGSYNGRFTLVNGIVRKLEQNNLIITGDLGGFVITTPDGVQYIFNKKEYSKAVTTPSSNIHFTDYSPNAWFLTKIIHPQGDIITLTYNDCEFNYFASTSQTYTYYERVVKMIPNTVPGESPKKDNYSTIISNKGVYLTQISSNSAKGGYLKFNYQPRTDLLNDYMLVSVSLYDNPSADVPDPAIKRVNLEYSTPATNSNYNNSYSSLVVNQNKRLFLMALYDGDKEYVFSYNDMYNLPVRGSYSQDEVGFFNGKDNPSLVPKPIAQRHSTAFSGYGDRKPDGNYSQKGLLSKIKFPTGGTDSIEYEPHTIFKENFLDCNEADTSPIMSTNVDGVFHGAAVNATVAFHVECTQEVYVTVGCTALSSTPPPDSYNASACLIDASVNPTVGMTCDWLAENGSEIKAGLNENKSFLVILPAGDYKLVIRANGGCNGSVNFQYKVPAPPFTGNLEQAGVRVKKITSFDPAGNPPVVKKYYYDDLTTGKSTATIFNPYPAFESQFTTFSSTSTFVPGTYNTKYYTKFTSANAYGLSDLTANHIYYNKVTEGYGEDFEGGGIEHVFINGQDGHAAVLMGSPISGAPLSNSGINGHNEVEKTTFRKQNNNVIIITQKEKTTFFDDPRLSSVLSFSAFSADAGGQNSVPIYSNCTLSDFKYINRNEFNLYSRWTYIKDKETITYDSEGLNPVSNKVTYTYNNTGHQQLSKEESINSKGANITKEYFYPPDDISGLSATAIAAKNELITDNIIQPLLQQKTSNNGNPVSVTRANYKIWPNNMVLPETIETQTGTEPLDKRISFNRYGVWGNIQEQQKTDGNKGIYIWDYTSAYLIAEIKGITGDTIAAHTSFEADGNGKWTYAGVAVTDPTAPTGTKCYNLLNGLSKTGLLPATVYVISYWTKNASPYTITGTTGGFPIEVNANNGWTMYQHEVTGVSSVSINGSGFIDEVRLYPKGTQMSTYTYMPLIGLHTSADPKGMITTYEYDSFRRLKNIRDQKGNIVKAFDYNYKH